MDKLTSPAASALPPAPDASAAAPAAPAADAAKTALGPSLQRRKWDPELQQKPRTDEAKRLPTQKLVVTAHYRRGDPNMGVTLKLTLPLSWEQRSIRDAVISPFVQSSGRRNPKASVAEAGPFEVVRVRYWSGPRPSNLSCHQYTMRPKGKLTDDRDPETEASKLMAQASQPSFIGTSARGRTLSMPSTTGRLTSVLTVCHWRIFTAHSDERGRARRVAA